MSKFFDLFPTVAYDIAGKDITNYQNVTNIFFRFRVLRKVLVNASAYYEYVITDADTPEILAEKLYGDAEAHWIVLMANEIVDPQFDWPLQGRDFEQYIIAKYGSVATAQSTVHHHELVVQREESASGLVTETRFEIDEAQLTENDLDDIPYDTYEALAETQDVNTIDMGEGKTVVETRFRDVVNCYDWEMERNEAKRHIKLIKKEWYPQIIQEFNNLTKNANAPFIRGFAS